MIPLCIKPIKSTCKNQRGKQEKYHKSMEIIGDLFILAIPYFLNFE
jgi:hypothetical protein